MFCSVYKWLISQAANSGKPISGFVKKHARRCDACREFARFCESLKPKLIQDKQALLENTGVSLNRKIMSALNKESASPSGRQVVSRRFLARKSVLVPSLAAAFFFVILSISLIIIVGPRTGNTPSFGNPSELVSAASPKALLVKAESPLEKEYVELRKAFDSTTQYLRSLLDFHIGEQVE